MTSRRPLSATGRMSTSLGLERVRVVLVRTSHPGNIGAAARAMKNMGFSRLFLVQPEKLPDDAALARSSGAGDILEEARVCESLDQALDGCRFVVATTARRRSLGWDNLDARSGAEEVAMMAEHGDVAIVFGPERSGLGNLETERSHCLIHIPVEERFSSMNLAAAVMLICYEIRLAMSGPASREQDLGQKEDIPAGVDRIEGVVGHLKQVMEATGYLTNKPAGRLMRRIRRLFYRSRMTEQDVNIFRGILSGIQAMIKRDVADKE